MNSVYSVFEASGFCMITIAFIYAFGAKNFSQNSKEKRLLHVFSIAHVLFSSFACLMANGIPQRIFALLCGICGFAASYLLLKLSNKEKCAKEICRNFICVTAALLFGTASFWLPLSGINASSYVLTFFIITLFAGELFNRIRVDNLTKLYNRYGMDVELKEQLRQYEREHNDSFYIIACDLDNFKHINDTWGHPEGDRALVLVANALARVGKRFSSTVFRIGGDEFIIITDTSEEGLAADVTNAVKEEMDKIEFRDDFDIRISIGTALYDGVTSIDDLLNNADKKLYEAKKNK